MTTWFWILLASAVAFGTKLAGYLAPDSWLDSPRLSRASSSVTVGLLASLVVVNAVGDGQRLVLDARLAAVAAAVAALWLRLPFVVVVLVGAAAAALARVAGAA